MVNFTSKTYVACAGGGGAINTGSFNILKATIKRDGTFTSTTSQNAVLGDANAKVTYFVTGRFQGRSATGAAAVDGVYRVGHRVRRHAQPQVYVERTILEGGSISTASDEVHRARHLHRHRRYVLCPGRRWERVELHVKNLRCLSGRAGGAINTGSFKILTATIKGDRSFTATTSQNAVLGGANAKLTYSVTGSFQGFSSAGAAGAAGVYRVDIVFTDTPNRRCTSSDQSWTAARSG